MITSLLHVCYSWFNKENITIQNKIIPPKIPASLKPDQQMAALAGKSRQPNRLYTNTSATSRNGSCFNFYNPKINGQSVVRHRSCRYYRVLCYDTRALVMFLFIVNKKLSVRQCSVFRWPPPRAPHLFCFCAHLDEPYLRFCYYTASVFAFVALPNKRKKRGYFFFPQNTPSENVVQEQISAPKWGNCLLKKSSYVPAIHLLKKIGEVPKLPSLFFMPRKNKKRYTTGEMQKNPCTSFELCLKKCQSYFYQRTWKTHLFPICNF